MFTVGWRDGRTDKVWLKVYCSLENALKNLLSNEIRGVNAINDNVERNTLKIIVHQHFFKAFFKFFLKSFYKRKDVTVIKIKKIFNN